MDSIIALCAAHSFGFAFFHMGFWKMFNWEQELKTASVSTRAIIQISNLRLIYIFLCVGVLCIAYPAELRSTPLGRAVLIGMACFWMGRLVEQFIFLRHNRKALHLLSGLFILGAALFLMAAML